MKAWSVQSWLTAVAILFCLGSPSWASTDQELLKMQEKLGKLLYFDKYLSKNKNQSCASCHFPAPGFVDPANVAHPATQVVSPSIPTAV